MKLTESSNASLIIVDDIPANLRLMCDMLGSSGYQLRPFSKPKLALESGLADPPDLFLLDISMPDMDGYELCSRLKEAEQTRAVPVIFLSAQKETKGIVEGFRCGAVDYITKPFQLEEVVSRVETHISLCEAKAALARRNQDLENALNQLKETQSQLVHSAKMASLGVLTAGIAHEINNPLNFVVANGRLLAGCIVQYEAAAVDGVCSLNSEDLECLRDIAEGQLDGGSRILEIVEGLRLFSRAEGGGYSDYGVYDNVVATVRLFKHLIANEIDLKVEVPETLKIEANSGQLNQVVANLVSNAIEAVKALNCSGKCIRIKGTIFKGNDEEWLLLEVQDNGLGVSEESRDRVFDPFYTTREPGKGLGLGLSISKTLVEEHGGELDFQSKLGETIFMMKVPCARR